MTREERADAIRFFKEVAEKEVDGAKYSKLAIEALEQECILDKIRAEIRKAWCTKPRNRYEEGKKDQALEDLKIIDKYKAESEGKDAESN